MEIESVNIKIENLETEYYPEDTTKMKSELNIESINGKLFRCAVCGHFTISEVLLNVHKKMHYLKKQQRTSLYAIKLDSNFNDIKHVHSASVENSSVTTNNPVKQFKNQNINAPLCETEKILLLEHIEKLGLNIKYKELEQIKGFLKDGWSKMVEVFNENDFNRNSEKLARTYFHLKNQAKEHIKRFYIHKKQPRPGKFHYIFVKLCPSDYEDLGLDLRELQEDSKIFDFTKDDSINDEERFTEDSVQLPHDTIEGNEIILPSTSQKRAYSEEADTGFHSSKIQVTDNNLKSLKAQLMLEEKRKEKEHEMDMKRKELEIKYREEIHKKDLQLRELEIKLLRKKLEN